MLRRIVQINSEKCNGCGLCVTACHEGAIGLDASNKAVLLRDDYCDGLGDCLPACPTGAISFETREALPYDEAAVENNMKLQGIAMPSGLASNAHAPSGSMPSAHAPNAHAPNGLQNSAASAGCPGSAARSLGQMQNSVANAGGSPAASSSASLTASSGGSAGIGASFSASSGGSAGHGVSSAVSLAGSTVTSLSALRQWPVQLKLVSVNAAYLNGADLLIAADCAAYAHGNFHDEFIRGRVTLIGCPKLDSVDYAEKLTEILRLNNIRSVTVARMSVPCCGGLEQAVQRAVQASGKATPLRVVTISPEGKVF